MTRLRVAVVGAGHLGKIHARLLASLPEVQLAAVADTALSQAQAVAKDYGIPAVSDPQEVVPLADAAIIATPTVFHHRVGMDLLRAGLHLFIEKPLAPTVAEAQELVETSEASGLTLQVGHVERFNPAFAAAAPFLEQPQYLEATRTSGYTFRSTDIGAVLDLMIHDIDLALALVRSPVERVEALGVSLLGKHEDMAQARLTFENGCVANLTASRASFVAGRRMQVFAASGFATLDFSGPSAKIVRPSEAIVRGEIDIDQLSLTEKQTMRERLFVDHLRTEELILDGRNAILEELRDFAASIAWNCAPQVDGRQGLAAVSVAERILNAISTHRWNTDVDHLYGPFAQPHPTTQPAVIPLSQPTARPRKAA